MRGVDYCFKPVGHTHGSDIADNKLIFYTKLFSQLRSISRAEDIALDAIFHHGYFAGWNLPVLDQEVFECRRDHHDVFRISIQKPRNCTKNSAQWGTRVAHFNCSQ